MLKATSKHLEEWANPQTVILMTLLLLGGLWFVVIVSTTAARQQSIDSSSDALQRMTYAVEAQTRQQLRLANAMLATVTHWMTENPARNPRHDPGFRSLIERLQRSSGDAMQIRLVGDDGRAFNVLAPGGAPLASEAAGDFPASLPADGGPYFGKPVEKVFADYPGLPIVQPLKSAAHGIRGLLVLIDLSVLGAAYEQQRSRGSGAIALLGRDGSTVVRAPRNEAMPGTAFPIEGLMGNASATEASGVLIRPNSSLDGRGRDITSYSSMPDYPFLIVVSEDYDQALAPWLRQTFWVVLLALGATVPLLVVAYRSLRLLQALAAQHAELQHLSTSDRLTGIGSRQHFVETLAAELEKVASGASSLTVLLFDIDFFKRLNDGYGHAIGDQVLISFAEAAKSCLRDVDLIGRLGAGEFAIMLPHTRVDKAVVVAERIRKKTAEIAIATEDGTVQFTTSAGVTAASATDESTDDLLKRAGRALHQAKAKGYDRVETL